MWQMTWDELDQEDVKPISQSNPSGTIYYRCGICGKAVGIHAGNCPHLSREWLYKRDKCENGHVVKWEVK